MYSRGGLWIPSALLQELRPRRWRPLLLGRHHAVGQIFGALPRRVFALLLSLLELVIRLLGHVVV